MDQLQYSSDQVVKLDKVVESNQVLEWIDHSSNVNFDNSFLPKMFQQHPPPLKWLESIWGTQLYVLHYIYGIETTRKDLTTYEETTFDSSWVVVMQQKYNSRI